ncbi:acyltransferase [Alloscardovia theropitheci]|uniref:Acyltransferase n=1 Tax=Alloscardovia theropitheci TaxID=2496842 RepID=A0A4R0QXI9_9BIFI|nr:acyltransferase [Alloscardovia theropitheci]TCD54161.1 acyltransferase [Alloscardovia theropitheci]
MARVRNWHIELLRIFSMFCIVATHYFAGSNFPIHSDPSRSHTLMANAYTALTMSGQVGVTIFVLISAYFLSASKSNFAFSSVWRIIKLWSQVFTYSVLIFIVFALLEYTHVYPTGWISKHNALMAVLPITFNEYWFATGFVVVLALSPVLNLIVDHTTQRQLCVVLCVLIYITFIWKFINPAFGYFNDGLYLGTIYLIGAYIRRYQDSLPRINFWVSIIITIAMYVLISLGTWALTNNLAGLPQWGGYPGNLFTAGPGASPILSVIAGVAIFISAIQWSNQHPISHMSWIGKATLALTPGVFGIYLIHENPFVKEILWTHVFSLPSPQGVLLAPYMLVSILIIFILLLLTSNIAYRIIIRPVEQAIAWISDKLSPSL